MPLLKRYSFCFKNQANTKFREEKHSSCKGSAKVTANTKDLMNCTHLTKKDLITQALKKSSLTSINPSVNQ